MRLLFFKVNAFCALRDMIQYFISLDYNIFCSPKSCNCWLYESDPLAKNAGYFLPRWLEDVS